MVSPYRIVLLLRMGLCFVFGGSGLFAQETTTPASHLIQVASFHSQQVTGVAVSKTGRIFVNFPDWSDSHTISVGEWKNGKLVPYPNEEWNRKGAPESHFVCVQSVYVDATDALWILDPASPKMNGVVKGGPKLVKVDLTGNEIVQIIPFNDEIAPEKSYLNDVRVDTNNHVAFITESGEGSLVFVDLKTGAARRRLKGADVISAESEFELTVNGRKLIDQKTGKPPKINADGIALDSSDDYLYFHALCSHTLYRVRTGFLTSPELSDEELSTRVEKAAETPAPDGMITGSEGKIYLTDIEHGAIVRFDPVTRKLETVLQDARLLWPDTMSWGPDGMLYVSCSQIENSPRFNNGKDMRRTPYKVFKFAVRP